MTAAPNIVRASAMGQAFANDPELRLPERPRLIDELLVSPAGADGVLFAGGESTQVLRGRSARDLLPRLLPLLDGERTLEQLALELDGVTDRGVHDAIALLFSRGVLEDGRPEEDAQAPQDVVSFLGRYNDVSRANRNRGEAWRRLAGAVVRVEGAEALAAIVRGQLAAAGARIAGATGAGALRVVVSTGDEPVEPERLDEWLRAGGVFLVRLGAREAHLGPMLAGGVTVCAGCLAATHPHPYGRPEALEAELWLSLAAQQVLIDLTRLSGSLIHRGFHRCFVHADGALGQETRLTPRMPGCPRCGIAGERWAPDDPRLLPWIYHSATSMTRRSTLALKEHQAHYLASNTKLATAAVDALPAASPVRLPPPAALDGALGWGPRREHVAPERLGLQELSGVLVRMAGEVGDGPRRRRLVPTGGNLGSVRLWVLARRVDGLERGAYLYEPRDHSLRFRSDVPDEQLAGALGGGSSLPACVVLGAGDVAKGSRKYRAFAFRLVHFDAGVALAYGHAVCRALGLHVREYPDFDLGLPRLFGVGRRWEHPVPTFALGLDAAPAAPPARLAPADYSPHVLVRMMNATASGELPPARPPGGGAPWCDAPQPLIHGLDEILRRRRATRVFSPAPPSDAVLRAVFAAAEEVVDARRAAGCAPSFVRPLLLVDAAGPDLPPGVYERRGRELVSRAAFGPEAALECTLQRGLATAPAHLVIVADLRAALAQRLARGYCEQAVHAGAAVGAAWLAATAHGLVGTAAGGVIADGLRLVAGLDGFNECPLLGFHAGLPAAARGG